MTGIRRASLLSLSVVLLGLWTGCEGDGSEVDDGMNPSAGTAGTAGSLNLDPMGEAGAGGAEASAGGGANQPPGPVVEECESLAELVNCSETSVEASYSAANVLLVIDKSG